MTTLNIPLSDERYAQIRELASKMKVTPEELARAGLEDWLKQPKQDFIDAANHVLQKNAELYRRLA